MIKISKFVIVAIILSLCLNISLSGLVPAGAMTPQKMKDGELATSKESIIGAKNISTDMEYFREITKPGKFDEYRSKFDLKKEGIQTIDLGRGFELVREFNVSAKKMDSTGMFQGVAATTWIKNVVTTYSWKYAGTPQYSFTQNASFLYDLTAVSYYSCLSSHELLAPYWTGSGSGGGGNVSNVLAQATSNWTFFNYLLGGMTRNEKIRVYCNQLGGVWEG